MSWRSAAHEYTDDLCSIKIDGNIELRQNSYNTKFDIEINKCDNMKIIDADNSTHSIGPQGNALGKFTSENNDANSIIPLQNIDGYIKSHEDQHN